jgi:hypothetical protein
MAAIQLARTCIFVVVINGSIRCGTETEGDLPKKVVRSTISQCDLKR